MIVKVLLTEEILDVIIVYNFLLEGICSGFGGTNHLDALCEGSSFAALQ